MKNQQDPRNWQRWNLSGAIDGFQSKTARTVEEYDSREGMTARLKTLEGFNAIIKARYRAFYKRKERLYTWIVLGRFVLDACGNTCPIIEFPSGFDALGSVPEVLSYVEFDELLIGHGLERRYAYSHSNGVPPARMPCAVCGNTWTVHDCWNCEAVSETSAVSLSDFVGRPFRAFRESLRAKTGAIYRTSYERYIRNDRFIDLRPDPNYSSHKMNELGWTRTKTPDAYVIQPGDETSVDCWRFQHPACGKERLAQTTEAEFSKTFERAGYQADGLQFTRIPSLYGPGCEGWTGPGFEVKTVVGQLIIGWRKRVIVIDWSKTGRNLVHLFRDMNTTKGRGHIHAWGYDNAVECLSRVRSALTAP